MTRRHFFISKKVGVMIVTDNTMIGYDECYAQLSDIHWAKGMHLPHQFRNIAFGVQLAERDAGAQGKLPAFMVDMEKYFPGFLDECRHSCLNVTSRAAHFKQSRGGFINPKNMVMTVLGDGIDSLNSNENIAPTQIGSDVDALTRYATSTSEEYKRWLLPLNDGYEHDKWFKSFLKDIRKTQNYALISDYMHHIHNCDDVDTIQNVFTMVKRSIKFLDIFGPKVRDTLMFEGGYSCLVSGGSGDFLTEDTLWDFKVSKKLPTSVHTLQLLMYWRMGVHSIHPEYQNVKKIGVYNPRMNATFTYDISLIPDDVISVVDDDVIGYVGEFDRRTDKYLDMQSNGGLYDDIKGISKIK